MKHLTLLEAPDFKLLKVKEIRGGKGLLRRLFSLGIHEGDLIKKDQSGIFGGPVLLRNITSNIKVAIGRGIASKIIVEISDEQRKNT
ncbi:MAG: FeoA domain-containing protein [Acidobacteriota bacterium]